MIELSDKRLFLRVSIWTSPAIYIDRYSSIISSWKHHIQFTGLPCQDVHVIFLALKYDSLMLLFFLIFIINIFMKWTIFLLLFLFSFVLPLAKLVNSSKLAEGMVLILDGNSEHVVHAWKNIQVVTCPYIIKCFKQIK